MVTPSAGTVFTGIASTGVGIRVVRNGKTVTRKILSESIARSPRLGPGDGDVGETSLIRPPTYCRTIPGDYRLTSEALQAIVKFWDITPYNPPRTEVAGWLSELCQLCEVYGVPPSQRALCAIRRMRTDCQEAAQAAGCDSMTWDQVTVWLLKYDGLLPSTVLFPPSPHFDFPDNIKKNDNLF
jgi:hypothetical protein